jgi:hypothetical protein
MTPLLLEMMGLSDRVRRRVKLLRKAGHFWRPDGQRGDKRAVSHKNQLFLLPTNPCVERGDPIRRVRLIPTAKPGSGLWLASSLPISCTMLLARTIDARKNDNCGHPGRFA